LRRLLDSALEGDDAALGELVRETQPMLWRLCSALGSRGEEEDLVQETYLRALQAMPGYRGDAPVVSWLLAIGRRVCADHVRRRQRQRRILDRLKVTTLEQVVDQPASIEDLVAGLNQDRRDAFVLTQLVGLSYEEAAACLDCPVGTIRSRVARARADLFTVIRRAQAR
jgi:RNA polymerase sigma-70 factor, ECF subfamily